MEEFRSLKIPHPSEIHVTAKQLSKADSVESLNSDYKSLIKDILKARKKY